MEIKKGISQMPEYPNQEINYVVPSDGKMYYILKDGLLDDGTVIATLDPKYAFDQTLPTNTVGAFKKDGSVLIDFDKKEIKKVSSDLLLAVVSKPVSKEVVDAQAKEADEISKSMILDNATVIKDKLINEMGITGELLFADAFGEANVYKTDSYNNKIGVDASFIGKTSKELYFHTNDVNGQSKVIKLDVSIPAVEEDTEIIDSIPVMEDVPSAPTVEEVETVSDVSDVEGNYGSDLKLDISQDILDGFANSNSVDTNETADSDLEEEITENVEDEVAKEEKQEEEAEEVKVGEGIVEKTSEDIEKEMNDSPFEIPNTTISTPTSDGNEVLDNVIAVMKKMIEETNKLNERITSLEKEIEEKDRVLEEQESKKDELSDLLDQANEVLEHID